MTRKIGKLLLIGLVVLSLTGIGIIGARHLARSRQKSDYLHSLQGLAFNKYLNLPASYDNVAHFGNWDGYLYTSTEYQCVLGGHYGLLAHPGIETDKTVIWLQPGQECWPDHPNCGTGSKTYTDEQGMQYMASGADGPRLAQLLRTRITRSPTGITFTFQPVMAASTLVTPPLIITMTVFRITSTMGCVKPPPRLP
jgi:hypothetical protein